MAGSLSTMIRELTREYTAITGSHSRYARDRMLLAFAGLICTEVLIFTTLFLSHLAGVWDTTSYLEQSMWADPSLLANTNTLLLGTCGKTMGLAALLRKARNSYSTPTLLACFYSLTFCALQVKEYRALSIYINETLASCSFYTLTGLHLSHVALAGTLALEHTHNEYYPPTRLHGTVLIYWHFVEAIWIFLYTFIYS